MLGLLAAAVLTWTPPTLNDDGSPLTDLTSYELWHGCTTPGAYDTVAVIPAPATTYTVTGLPATGTCYFAAKATNSLGVSSVFSAETTRVMATLPGVVQTLNITWQESVVAISQIGAAMQTIWVNSRSVTADLPAGVAVDDMAIFFAGEVHGHAISATAETTVIGATQGAGADQSSGVLYRILDATDVANGTVTLTNLVPLSTDDGGVTTIAMRGVDTANPVDVAAETNAGIVTSVSGPSITPTGDNKFVIHAIQADPPDTSYTATKDTAPVTTWLADKQDGRQSAFMQGYQQGTAAAIALDFTGLTSDTWLAHSFALNPAASSGISVVLGGVVETDNAQVLASAKQNAVGLVSEADLAQPTSRMKSKATGQAPESNTAFPIGRAKAKNIGLLSEADQVFAMTVAGAKNVAIGLVAQSDSVLAFTRAKQKAIGLLGETNLAQTLGLSKAVSTGLITEAGFARPFGVVVATTLGLAVESDTTFSAGSAKAKSIGLLFESDTPLQMSAGRALQLGLVTESDIAFGLAVAKAASLGILSESDTVFAFTSSGPAGPDRSAVRVIVEARNRTVIVEKRNQLIIAAPRSRRIDVKKLN